MNYPRKTKIIVTLGPATSEPEMIKKLMLAGVNVFRFNMSHAPHEWVHKTAKSIRGFSDELSNPVAILLDTQGPAIRTGDLPAKLDLKPGDVFTFTVRGEKSEEAYSVDVNYDDLVNDINVGDTVLVDNGVIQMKVFQILIQCKETTQIEQNLMLQPEELIIFQISILKRSKIKMI